MNNKTVENSHHGNIFVVFGFGVLLLLLLLLL